MAISIECVKIIIWIFESISEKRSIAQSPNREILKEQRRNLKDLGLRWGFSGEMDLEEEKLNLCVLRLKLLILFESKIRGDSLLNRIEMRSQKIDLS